MREGENVARLDAQASRRRRVVMWIGTMLMVGAAIALVYGGLRPSYELPESIPLAPTTSEAPSPTVTESASSAPSASSSPSPSASAPKVTMRDPVGKPRKLRIVRGAKVIVDQDDQVMVPSYLQPDGALIPAHKKVGWYAEAGWPLPGQKNVYRSLIVGHVTHKGKADVFIDLPNVRKGDVVEITYPRGVVMKFKVTTSGTVDKDDVFPSDKDRDTSRDTYRWVRKSSSGKPERVISIFTCDPGSGVSTKTNRLNANWIVQAVRIS